MGPRQNAECEGSTGESTNGPTAFPYAGTAAGVDYGLPPKNSEATQEADHDDKENAEKKIRRSAETKRPSTTVFENVATKLWRPSDERLPESSGLVSLASSAACPSPSKPQSSLAPVVAFLPSCSMGNAPDAPETSGARRVLVSLPSEPNIPRMVSVRVSNVVAAKRKIKKSEGPHKYTHADNLKWNCEFCDYAAKQKYHLDRHREFDHMVPRSRRIRVSTHAPGCGDEENADRGFLQPIGIEGRGIGPSLPLASPAPDAAPAASSPMVDAPQALGILAVNNVLRLGPSGMNSPSNAGVRAGAATVHGQRQIQCDREYNKTKSRPKKIRDNAKLWKCEFCSYEARQRFHLSRHRQHAHGQPKLPNLLHLQRQLDLGGSEHVDEVAHPPAGNTRPSTSRDQGVGNGVAGLNALHCSIGALTGSPYRQPSLPPSAPLQAFGIPAANNTSHDQLQSLKDIPCMLCWLACSRPFGPYYDASPIHPQNFGDPERHFQCPVCPARTAFQAHFNERLLMPQPPFDSGGQDADQNLSSDRRRQEMHSMAGLSERSANELTTQPGEPDSSALDNASVGHNGSWSGSGLPIPIQIRLDAEAVVRAYDEFRLAFASLGISKAGDDEPPVERGADQNSENNDP